MERSHASACRGAPVLAQPSHAVRREGDVEWSLMPHAEQEQDDDQRERRAEKPEKNQDHLVTSLYPRRAVGCDRTAGHACALTVVEAEVHPLPRGHPAADY